MRMRELFVADIKEINKESENGEIEVYYVHHPKLRGKDAVRRFVESCKLA